MMIWGWKNGEIFLGKMVFLKQQNNKNNINNNNNNSNNIYMYLYIIISLDHEGNKVLAIHVSYCHRHWNRTIIPQKEPSNQWNE